MSVKIGDEVRVKKGSYERLGIGGGATGGEATVVDVCEDKHGPYYVVSLHRNGRRRSVRRTHLVVHRKKGRKKGWRDQSDSGARPRPKSSRRQSRA